MTGFLLILFMAYYANATLFRHAHIINGVTIVHSHLYCNNHLADPSGGHTTTDVTLIAQLNHITCLDTAIGEFIAEPLPTLETIPTIPLTEETNTASVYHFHLRAPPLF